MFDCSVCYRNEGSKKKIENQTWSHRFVIPNTLEAEAGRLQAQDLPRLQHKWKASLGNLVRKSNNTTRSQDVAQWQSACAGWGKAWINALLHRSLCAVIHFWYSQANPILQTTDVLLKVKSLKKKRAIKTILPPSFTHPQNQSLFLLSLLGVGRGSAAKASPPRTVSMPGVYFTTKWHPQLPVHQVPTYMFLLLFEKVHLLAF